MQKVMSFPPREDPRNIASYRRESSFWKEIALIDLDEGECRASVRFYGSGSVVYCVAWFWGRDKSCRGYGKAGGYGYHKPSAAMEEALKAAGCVLAEPIDGRGDSAMRDAMLAIADYFGISRPYLHLSHG